MHCNSVLVFIDLLKGEITSQPERLGRLDFKAGVPVHHRSLICPPLL